MTELVSQLAADASARRRAIGAILVPLVTGAIFTAAALLFWVQPMFGKMVLPLLGGSPAVWTTALLFFQTALLVGYLYAHALGSLLAVRAQIAVHVTVMLAAAFVLPVAIPAGALPDGNEAPVLWLVSLFVGAVGLPYTVVAATSPLLQRWFALSGHQGGADPYYLYVASNGGSLIGLLGYPLIAEPLIGVSAQSGYWTAGYLTLAALITAAGVAIWQAAPKNGAEEPANPGATTKAPVSALDRIRWVALAFVPSSLLLGVTTHVTTDIAAAPLLWAAPLALYLITFMFAFARRPLIPRAILFKVEAITIVILSALMWFHLQGLAGLALHLMGFFVIALARHSALAESRPDTSRLTEFYLWMSFGGALGGAFNAIVAPQIFSHVLEYPLAIVAAAATRLLMPGAMATKRVSAVDLGLLAAAALATVAAYSYDIGASIFLELIVVMPFALAAYLVNANAVRFAFVVALMFGLLQVVRQDPNKLMEARSFFGAYRVIQADNGRYVRFTHGTTLHGVQATSPDRRRQPLVYYATLGPLGQAVEALQASHSKLRYGLVGLGAGASVCYARPGDSWTLYEIDALVVHIARDSGNFTFIKDCAPGARVVLGDARLSLSREPNAVYDVLILDAFSSDSIPMHLVTREALTLARAKLAPGGVILFNISNRYLRLEPVVANAARAAGLVGVAQFYPGTPKTDGEPADTSHWLALAANPTDLATVANAGNWRPLKFDPNAPLWTDDFSNLVGVISFGNN